ncbi:MAG: aldehyde ferredoxin oxidoreductase N-terminal domain-containing protein [Dehalococcoidales bacterium]|nr:aldehyde ferredoxin oxidoreductase N-terminal domain-containing protein [Dehalococcoidales bacterium]
MWYGWTGVQLEVNLTEGTIRKVDGNREMYETYLGGHGLITRMFWDRVPPETEPFSPENLLIFGAGPLVGTPAPSANRTNVVTRSPQTNYLTNSNMGGSWAPQLKFAGYDTLTISGKSPVPVYLYINDDKVEIRDASHLWGKDVFETQSIIRDELKNDHVQTLCIGPAGEHRVFFASIEHGPGFSLSRSGVGAIMGDKKLKAVTVHGTKDVHLSQPLPFLELCNDILRRAENRKMLSGGDDDESPRDKQKVEPKTAENDGEAKHRGKNLYRNFELMKSWKGRDQEYQSFLMRREATMVGCFNCPTPDHPTAHLPDGQPVLLKCRSRHRFTGAADIHDFDFNLRCISLVQRYGFDTLSAAALCVFVIDLYQKGIITREDTGGMHLEWSNPEVFFNLLKKIAYREGIGDILANGVHQAAQQIGRGAEQYAYHTRKLEPRGRQMHGLSGAVKLILNDRQDTSQWGTYGYEGLSFESDEFSQWYAESEFWEYPQEWKKDVPSSSSGVNYEMMSKTIVHDAESGILADCLGLCHRWSGGRKYTRILDSDQAALFSYATGLELNDEEAKQCVRRVRAITRVYNVILGERMQAGDLPEQFLSRDRDKLGQLLEDTNRLMGYDAEGIPTAETLAGLGLEYAARELERRGILPQPVSTPAV